MSEISIRGAGEVFSRAGIGGRKNKLNTNEEAETQSLTPRTPPASRLRTSMQRRMVRRK